MRPLNTLVPVAIVLLPLLLITAIAIAAPAPTTPEPVPSVKPLTDGPEGPICRRMRRIDRFRLQGRAPASTPVQQVEFKRDGSVAVLWTTRFGRPVLRTGTVDRAAGGVIRLPATGAGFRSLPALELPFRRAPINRTWTGLYLAIGGETVELRQHFQHDRSERY